jgi:hypothetical protein
LNLGLCLSLRSFRPGRRRRRRHVDPIALLEPLTRSRHNDDHDFAGDVLRRKYILEIVGIREVGIRLQPCLLPIHQYVGHSPGMAGQARDPQTPPRLERMGAPVPPFHRLDNPDDLGRHALG